MKNPIKHLSLAALLMLPTAFVAADMSFYNERSREGWFFYDDPEPEVEEELVEPPKPEPAPPAKSDPAPPPGPVPLSAAWLKEHMPKYLNRAVDTADPEDIKQYLILQKIAMDKADKFSFVSQSVVQANPMLDANANRSLSTFGSRAKEQEAGRNTDLMMAELAQQAGLIMFFRSDCTACMQEVPIIKAMSNKYGFTVKAISLDGLPLPGNPFDDWTADGGWAEKLNVTVTPTTYLYSKKGGFSMIGAGVMAQDTVVRRIKVAALDSGLITQQQWDESSSSAGQSNLLDLPKIDAKDQPKEEALPDTPWGNDPQKLIKYLSTQGVRR